MPSPPNGLQDSTTGILTPQKGTGGRGHSRPIAGTGKAHNNRQLLGVATTYSASTNKMSWATADAITYVSVYIPPTDAAAGSNCTGAIMTINAPNDTAAGNWLDAAIDSATTEVMFFPVPVGVLTVFEADDDVITRLDFEALGAACDIIVGAS